MFCSQALSVRCVACPDMKAFVKRQEISCSVWWMGQEETVLYGNKRKYSWQLASTALNLNHLQRSWNLKPEVLLHSGMFKCMCKAKFVN